MTFQDRKRSYRQDKCTQQTPKQQRVYGRTAFLHYSVQCSQFSPRSPKVRFILLSNHGLSSLYWEVTALDYTLQLQAATHPSNSSSNIINIVVMRGRLFKKKKKSSYCSVQGILSWVRRNLLCMDFCRGCFPKAVFANLKTNKQNQQQHTNLTHTNDRISLEDHRVRLQAIQYKASVPCLGTFSALHPCDAL